MPLIEHFSTKTDPPTTHGTTQLFSNESDTTSSPYSSFSKFGSWATD